MADSGLENNAFCCLFHTLEKVFLQKQLFAIAPDIIAGRSANLGAYIFWNLHENNIKQLLALFWASLKEFLLESWLSSCLSNAVLYFFSSQFVLRYCQDSQIRIQKTYSRTKLLTKLVFPCLMKRRIWIQTLVLIAAARRVYQKGPFFLSLKQ